LASSYCELEFVPVVDPGTGPDLSLLCPVFWPPTPVSVLFWCVLPVSQPVAMITRASTDKAEIRIIQDREGERERHRNMASPTSRKFQRLAQA